MRELTALRWSAWPSCVCLAVVAACWPSSARGGDYQRFLDALRERGYFDMALEYLARAPSDRSVPAELKKRVPYEEGVTLIMASVAERDVDQKVKHLNAAAGKLTEFIKGAGDRSVEAEAESQLGNVLVERAKILLFRAKQPKNAAQKDALATEARKLFAEAQQTFASAERKFAEHLKQFPKPGDQPGATESAARQEARVDLRRARLFAAQALYESSKTYPPDSPEARKILESASKKFDELQEKYRGTLFGLLARTYQGRCYLDVGDMRRAAGIFTEILAQPDDPDELRRLKAHALHLAMQAWTSESEKKYDEAAHKGQDWLAKARGTEARSADWLAVRYYTAVALARHAETLPQKESTRRKQELADARKQAKDVAAHAGEYQEPAKRLYQELVGSATGDDKPVTTFAEASERGRDALDVMQTKLNEVKLAEAANDRQAAATAERECREARDSARELFRLALSLRTNQTPIDDVNAVRYYLCYLSYQAGDYYDSAVLGDFLAKRYPTATQSRYGAKIALLSYLQNYNAAAPDDRAADKQRMLALADFMTRRWAGETEADEAWMALMVVATGERDVDGVLACLAKIPEDSPRRGEAELKAGQALWVGSLAAARQGAEDAAEQATVTKMREQARDTLDRGVGRLRKLGEGAGASLTVATGVLSLAQIYVELNQPEKALELLEDPKIGPIALVEAKSPIAQEGTFTTETNKAALRAYVATGQLDKAEKMMNALESSVSASGTDAKANQMLIAIYRALGQELEQQVAAFRKEHRTKDLEKVSRGFELFLDRITKKEQGNNFNSLNWVAETFSRLGAGHETEGETPSQQARAYFGKAAAADKKILSSIASDATFASPEAALAVKVRLARSQRRSGQYLQAINLLTDVLKEKPMLVDVQKEAAYTYQDWGREDPSYYAMAIAGGRPVKDDQGQESSVVWGWSRLSAMTQRNKKMQDAFHEARYNLANCRLLLALTQKGDEKAATLKKAEGDVLLTARLHPDMGGGDWPKKYDALLRKIQQAAGRQPTGLPQKAATAKTGDAGAPK
ncbi:MAG: hypothetical protein HYX69_08380 [Planctomycetia bacterium]|nr:hypothetical protein [Planctomycetia bacterium]